MGRVFISHSHRDAPEAGTISDGLERAGIQTWMAPRDVTTGLSYPRAIIEAIRSCSAGVVLVSEHSNHSEHVAREVERLAAVKVPLVIVKMDDVDLSEELEYFTSLHQWVDCHRATMSAIVPELAASIQRLLDESTSGTKPTRRPVASIDAADVDLALNFSELAQRQRAMLINFGSVVIDFICRREHPSEPIPRRDLVKLLVIESPGTFDQLTFREFSRLLDDAKSGGCAPGLSESDAGVFVMEENFSIKLDRNKADKAALVAQHAALMVKDGDRIGMDGGSTTLPLAEILAERLAEGYLDDVTVLTNSLSVASVFSELMATQGWTDSTSPVAVVMAGGTLRPNTHAIAWTPVGTGRLAEAWTGLLHGSLDRSFIGANGFSLTTGLTMGNPSELAFKRLLMTESASAFYLADVSKAGIQLPVQIADWHEEFALLTNPMPVEMRDELQPLLRSGKIQEIP